MKPNYYLSSLEVRDFQTHECYVVKPVRFATGCEGIIVRVNPVVIGQRYGLGGADIDYLVLFCDIETDRINPPSRLPCLVRAWRFLSSNWTDIEPLKPQDISLVAFGEIYKTRYDADNHVFPKHY